MGFERAGCAADLDDGGELLFDAHLEYPIRFVDTEVLHGPHVEFNLTQNATA